MISGHRECMDGLVSCSSLGKWTPRKQFMWNWRDSEERSTKMVGSQTVWWVAVLRVGIGVLAMPRTNRGMKREVSHDRARQSADGWWKQALHEVNGTHEL